MRAIIAAGYAEPMAIAETITISDAARLTGLTAHTLRYYERAGLMLDVERGHAAHRRYTEADIGWIELLTRLRATGMPIRKVREYADLVREGAGNEAERLAVLEAHRREVLEHLDETRRNLAAIDRKIDYYRETANASTPVSSADASHSRSASAGSTA
jgi:DNA-binding transcriptional MerR regulator